VVLRGAGENFCLGRDTAGLAEGGPPSALDVRENNTGPALDVYAAFRDCRVPIIGVIHGAAHGFGCAVAGLCDITIAADDASFKVPEMDRDLPPALVMSALSDRVLRKAIMYLVYSRAEVDADTALTMGIVSTVVPAADLGSQLSAISTGCATTCPNAETQPWRASDPHECLPANQRVALSLAQTQRPDSSGSHGDHQPGPLPARIPLSARLSSPLPAVLLQGEGVMVRDSVRRVVQGSLGVAGDGSQSQVPFEDSAA